ncbi:hypothetical protein LINPERHAP1_LOCUS32133 [Linum perenne]
MIMITSCSGSFFPASASGGCWSDLKAAGRRIRFGRQIREVDAE